MYENGSNYGSKIESNKTMPTSNNDDDGSYAM
jgi:hypothetical protein